MVAYRPTRAKVYSHDAESSRTPLCVRVGPHEAHLIPTRGSHSHNLDTEAGIRAMFIVRAEHHMDPNHLYPLDRIKIEVPLSKQLKTGDYSALYEKNEWSLENFMR
jgi:hypothetical protein